MRIQVEHSKLGQLPLTGNPIKMGGDPTSTSRAALPPPLLGEHTEAVLREKLGLDPERLRSLQKKGVFGA